MTQRSRSAAILSFTLAALAAAPLPAFAARDSGAATPEKVSRKAAQTTTQSAAQTPRQQYAVEFRSRYALSYGHVFLMYGPLNAKGEFAHRTVAGLHPKGDDPQPWMIGHVVPVVSETGPSDGDLEDQFVSASYRVVIGPEEYKRVVAYIKQKQATSPTWHAVFNNCAGWVGNVGEYMGLKAPSPLFIYPKDWINKMKAMNAGNDRSTALSLAQ